MICRTREWTPSAPRSKSPCAVVPSSNTAATIPPSARASSFNRFRYSTPMPCLATSSSKTLVEGRPQCRYRRPAIPRDMPRAVARQHLATVVAKAKLRHGSTAVGDRAGDTDFFQYVHSVRVDRESAAYTLKPRMRIRRPWNSSLPS